MAKRRARPDLTGLAAATGDAALAAGVGEAVVLAGTRTRLALRDETGWRAWPWETIASGSWRGDANRFSWRTVTGEEFGVELSDAGALPALFRERVQASTLVTVVLDVPGGEVQVVGRRSLGSEARLSWYAIASGGADLADEATRALVVAETDRLRAELDTADPV